MLFKGTIDIEVGGKKIGLKFGMLATGYFCEQEKIGIKDFSDRLKNPTPLTFIHVFLAAARAHCSSKKEEFTYTVDDAGDWIDEIGIDKASMIIYDLMSVYEEKSNQDEKKVLTEPTPEIQTIGQ